jgi:hypothetical protein
MSYRWSSAVGFTVPAIAAALALVGFTHAGQNPKYSDGVELSVTYVGPGESSDLPVWAADGSPTERPDAKSSRYYGGKPAPGKRSVAVGFRLVGGTPFPDDDPTRQSELEARLNGLIDNGGGTSGFIPNMNANRHFMIPDNWKTADLSIGRGVGPYRTVSINRHGSGNLEINPTKPDAANVGRADNQFHFKLPVELVNKDWRISAFDGAGKRVHLVCSHFMTEHSPDPLTPMAQTSESLESVDRFVLEARDYEWATVKGISLYPSGNIRP